MGKGTRDPDYGKEVHKRKVWEWAKGCPMFYNRLDNCKEGRWFQIVERSLVHLAHWAVLGLIGCYMGTINGWDVKYVHSDVLDDHRVSHGHGPPSRINAPEIDREMAAFFDIIVSNIHSLRRIFMLSTPWLRAPVTCVGLLSLMGSPQRGRATDRLVCEFFWPMRSGDAGETGLRMH